MLCVAPIILLLSPFILSLQVGATTLTSPNFPLTTTFTPPPNCFTDVSLFSGYGYPTAYSVGLGVGNEFSACSNCWQWLGLASASTCFPPSYSFSAIFSPGVCPSGYYIACGSTNVLETVTETVATCCPGGYLCAPSSRIAAWPWYAAQPCSSYPDLDLSIQALSVGGDATITTEFPATLAPEFAILANSVQVRWQSTDVDLFSLGATASSAVPSPAQSAPTSSTSPAYGNNPSEPSITAGATSNSLSSGAKAGIGIGVAVVALGIVTGAFLCIRQRRQVSNSGPGMQNPEGRDKIHGQFLKPELEAITTGRTTQTTERSQLGTETISELDTARVPELEAGWKR